MGTFRRVGLGLMAYWGFSLCFGTLLQLLQPDQLGIPEAYIYHSFVIYPSTWVFILGIACLNRDRPPYAAAPWPRALASGIMTLFFLSLAIGLVVGWLRMGYDYDIVYNMLFRGFFSPPPELLLFAIVLWMIRRV